MELTQTALRGILAQILSVNSSHIVPKQGNWWNPQENPGNIKNWVAYRIRSNRPRTAPYYNKNQNNKNEVCVQKIAEIELQFVGPDSEELAESVAAWPLRADVKAQFETVQGAIMYDDLNAVSSFFYQDGANSVLAWNVVIRVLWISTIETSQQLMPLTSLNGGIK